MAYYEVESFTVVYEVWGYDGGWKWILSYETYEEAEKYIRSHVGDSYHAAMDYSKYKIEKIFDVNVKQVI